MSVDLGTCMLWDNLTLCFFFSSFFFTQSVQEIFQTLIKEIENHDQDGNVDKKEDCTILWHACIFYASKDIAKSILWYSFLHSTLFICYRHFQFVLRNSFRQPYMLLPWNLFLVLFRFDIWSMNSLKLLKRCFPHIWPIRVYRNSPLASLNSHCFKNIFISLEFPSNGCTL